MNFGKLSDENAKPKLLFGAPADIVDDMDHLSVRETNDTSSSANDTFKTKTNKSEGISVPDNDLSDEDLAFVCDEAVSPSKKFNLKTTYSLDQAMAGNKKKRKRRGFKASLATGMVLPGLQTEGQNDETELKLPNEQLNAKSDTNAIENLFVIWSQNANIKNCLFFETLTLSFRDTERPLTFFANSLVKFNSENVLNSDLFEKSFELLETFLIKNPNRIDSNLEITVQQSLLESVCELDFTPNLKKCLELYRLKDVMGNAFVFVIQKLIGKKNFKQLALIVHYLNLFAFVDLTRDLFMPLVAQNNVNVLEIILSGEETLQWDLVYFLDSVCSPKYRFTDALNETYEDGADAIPKIQYDKIRPMSVSKLTRRLMKKWGMEMEKAHNVYTGQLLSQMDFYLHTRYDQQMSQQSRAGSTAGGGGSTDNMDELIHSIAVQRDELKVELVRKCLHYNDRNMALTWFHYYDLKLIDLEEDIKPVIEEYLKTGVYKIQKLPFSDQKLDPSLGSIECSETNPSLGSFGGSNPEVKPGIYYTLKIPESNIVIVDDFNMFMRAADSIVKKKIVRMVGLDCEWKPGFEKTANQVALLQLATSDFVYLFDLTVIESKIDPCVLKWFFKHLFTSRRITKLGFGFGSDLNALASYSFFSECLQDAYIRNLVDICDLVQKVETSYPSFFPYSAADLPIDYRQEKGLSLTVFKCFGTILNKTEQLSNWERRPLRDAQILYAALDAACLIDIYSFITSRLNELETKSVASLQSEHVSTDVKESNLNITPNDDLAAVSLTRDVDQHVVSSATTGSRRRAIVNMFGEPVAVIKRRSGEKLEVGDLKFVVDGMLEGIVKYLRMWGVDCITASPINDPQEALDVAMKEKRVLLTAGKNYHMAAKQIGVEQVLEVSTLVKAIDQAKYVFRHFGMSLDKSLLFLRCSLCNGDDYITTPAPVVRALVSILDGKHCNWKKLAGHELFFSDHFDPETAAILKSGKLPIFEGIAPTVFDQEQEYYICVKCGKVYWEGGHHERAMKNFSDLWFNQDQN